MTSNPKVTVLMSVYNGEKYLREAIDSILNQTFKDFEFIIINDGSTDTSRDIILSYDDPRIKLIDNEENIGLTKSLNKGLELAKGEYIARQDADDASVPERLEKEIEFLDTHGDHAVVGTFANIINVDSKIVRIWERPEEYHQILEAMKKDNVIIHGSTIIRMSDLLDVGLYDESFPKSQDYDLWLRLSEKYLLANIPEKLYLVRSHEEQIGVAHREEQLKCVEIAKKKAKERAPNSILIMVQRGLIKIEEATQICMAYTLENKTSQTKGSKVRKALIKFRYAKRINLILSNFHMNNISLEKAESSLNDIINR